MATHIGNLRPVWSGTIKGRMHWLFDIASSAVGTTDELILDLASFGIPPIVTVSAFKVNLVTAGSATTIRPRIGTRAAFAADSEFEELATSAAAAAVYNASKAPMQFSELPSPLMVIRFGPDATATLIRTKFTLIEGHDVGGV